jgi:hypothetical protein
LLRRFARSSAAHGAPAAEPDMADQNSLALLHPLVTADPVPWFPPAPGWYWLGSLLGTLALYLAIKRLRQFQRDAYRRAALVELSQLAQSTELQALQALLRRTAIIAYSRSEVASLTGSAWWRFLDAASPETFFIAGGGELLDRATYQPSVKLSSDEQGALLSACSHWIRHHVAPQESRSC